MLLNIVIRGRDLARGQAPPPPVTNFRQVVAVFGDVALVIEQFFADHLLRIGCARAQLRNAIDHFTDQVESVELVAASTCGDFSGRCLPEAERQQQTNS
jgi:hypothetical protein